MAFTSSARARLLRMTAAENIAVGRIEARDDRPRIEHAAHQSLADEVIEKLPLGYDQVIGKRFKKGVDLSAVQGAERRETAVLISHRFSSVRMADRILVLAEGTVEAEGTHGELLAQGGRYAELFELQAAGYR